VSTLSSPGAERIWPESNCYVDLWVGVLRDLSLEPEAMLACTAAPRFEGDQWTFCKPTATELAELYGLRVEELTIWRSLREHVAVQLGLGRLVLVEVDAFHLPDTVGVSYRTAHQKTTIGIVGLDEAQRRLDYYHNAGRYQLSGDELDAVLSSRVLGADLDAAALQRLASMGGEPSTLSDIMQKADVVIATTGARGLIKPEAVRKGQIILALSNPDPEIEPAVALAHGAAIAADGKGINNLLGFPGLFKGALAVRAKRFTDAMLLAAAGTIAELAKGDDLVPDPLEREVHQAVAAAVSRSSQS